MGKNNELREVNRRDFLKGAAVIAAGAAAMGMAGCSTGGADAAADAATSGKRACEPEAWDAETDVVVMGYGFAGEASAISAAAEGSQVIVFEKAPEEHAGGNSAVSCGFLNICSGDGAAEAWKAITDGGVTDAECVAVAKASTDMPQWFSDNIVESEVIHKEGADAVRKLWGKEYPDANAVNLTIEGKGQTGGGAFLHKLVADVMADRYADSITVLYSAPVTDLVYDAEAKEVLGVQYEEGGQTKYCKAKKGVIMACGGYEGNPEMIENFVLTHYKQYPIGSPYNTGDGIRMVAGIGAKLRHMAAVEYGSPACLELSEKYNQAIACYNGGDTTSMIYVSQHGERFMAEDGKWPAHDKRYPYPCFTENKDTAETPNYPWWMVFDETRRTKGTLFAWSNPERNEGWAAVRNVYHWSDDNMKEVEDGVVLKADTIEELGGLMGFADEDLATFVATVEKFNADVADGGTDSVFGRAPSKSQKGDVTPVNPLVNPPFYAVQCCISFLNTNGGPARNDKWQALDWNDEPIGRLYSAGEFGSVFYHYYWGGGNINECFASGMMTGQQVNALSDWSAA
ncbi:FAD-binding protein [Arabiibacter massiliensis]|uniref:FAD-binding protein n=1 Tax=Arabiibacter massiliensis TaxID=1870985 RepID=UPI0009BB0F63|nr:FAD-binding protein [Arabiibacter massiliensis]